MTKQGNIRNKFEEIRLTASACTVITATVIAMMSVEISMNQHSAYAQMIGDHISSRNMTPGSHEAPQEKMINGTINLEQTIIEAIDSKVNISLTQAIATAERTVGNNSFTLAAFGAVLGGDLVNMIILGTPGTDFYNVIVDPGNGQILSLQQSSQKEIEEMHLKHSEAMLEDGSTGVGGFGLRALRH